MLTMLSPSKIIHREPEQSATVSTTFNKRTQQKFTSRPFAMVRSLRSMAQSSNKDINSDANIYYICPTVAGVESIFLPDIPYEFRIIDEQSEELASDDIAVHNLSRSISRPSVDFVAPSSHLKRGRFVEFSNSSETGLPRSSSRYHNIEIIDADFETDKEEPFWRGVFPLPSSSEVIFSQKVSVKLDELPSWEPHIVIDSYRLEDDDD